MKVGAFANNKKEILNDNPDIIMPNAPFSKLLCERIPSPVPSVENQPPPSTKTATTTLQKEDKNGNSESPEKENEADQTSEITMVSTNDDFIMVDLVNLFTLTGFVHSAYLHMFVLYACVCYVAFNTLLKVFYFRMCFIAAVNVL